MHEKEFTQENWPQLRQILPDMLFLLAGILTLLGAKVYLDGAYHPTWGDRPDGRKLRTLDPDGGRSQLYHADARRVVQFYPRVR